jgi:hypothetical protein
MQVEMCDHLSWRSGMIWHHCLVVEKLRHGTRRLGVVEYAQSKDGQMEIQENTVEFEPLLNQSLRRHDYSDKYLRSDVLIRADALIGERSYDLVSRNCESVVRFMTTGETISHQTSFGTIVL